MSLGLVCNLLAVVRHAMRPTVGTGPPPVDVDLEDLAERLRRADQD